MKEITESAMRDAEEAAKEISSVPKSKEDLMTALSQAFKDGIRVGSALQDIKEPA